jgi:hypothetical protein
MNEHIMRSVILHALARRILTPGNEMKQVRFEIFAAVTMKNSVFWDLTPLREESLRSVRRLVVTANVIPIPHILVTLMMEALNSYETSVLTRAIGRNIPEDATLLSQTEFTKNNN